MAAPVTLRFSKDREMKRHTRYAEVVPPAVAQAAVGSIYLHEHVVVMLGRPETIELTLSSVSP